MSNEPDIVFVQSLGDVVLLRADAFTIDVRNAKTLQREILGQAGPAKKVVIDLSKVDYIDSAGLGTLISTLRHFLAAGGDLRLAGPTVRVQVLFEVTRLERVFNVFPDVDAAIASFA